MGNKQASSSTTPQSGIERRATSKSKIKTSRPTRPPPPGGYTEFEYQTENGGADVPPTIPGKRCIQSDIHTCVVCYCGIVCTEHVYFVGTPINVWRDVHVFSDMRLILVSVQSLTGKHLYAYST